MITVQCGTTIFSGIQAIVFDKDGTLADSAHYLRLLAQRRSRLLDALVPGIEAPLLLAFGVDGDRLDPAGLMAVGSRAENEIAAAAYVAETGRSWLDALTTVKKVFREAELSPIEKATATPIFPGCQTLIAQIAQAGAKIAIASADTAANIQAFIQCYELSKYIQHSQGSDTDQHIHKPDPAFFLHLCQRLNVTPSQTLMVGDSQLDIQMAKQAGAAGTIGISSATALAPWLIEADGLLAQVNQLQIHVTPMGNLHQIDSDGVGL